MKNTRDNIPSILLTLTLLFWGCNSIETGRKNDLEQIGEIIQRRVSTERFSNFFENDKTGFFPISGWLIDFDYNKSEKELYLTHLNTPGCTSSALNFSITLSNDSIFINEKVCKHDVKANKEQDIEYIIKDIEAKVYYIIINKQPAVKLDLTDINEKWNYSLLKDGSYIIFTNENGSKDEII